MQRIRGLAPLGIVALACLPCVALAAGVTGGVVSGIGAALVSPAVGIPLVVVGVILVAFGTVLWRRRGACDLPPGGPGRTSRRRAAPSSPTPPLVPGPRAPRAAVRRVETRR